MFNFGFLPSLKNVDCVPYDKFNGFFDPRFSGFGNAKWEKRVFNNGNPANAFQVATSKQLVLERAQRLVIGLTEKLVESHFGYVIRDGVLAIALEKGSQ